MVTRTLFPVMGLILLIWIPGDNVIMIYQRKIPMERNAPFFAQMCPPSGEKFISLHGRKNLFPCFLALEGFTYPDPHPIPRAMSGIPIIFSVYFRLSILSAEFQGALLKPLTADLMLWSGSCGQHDPKANRDTKIKCTVSPLVQEAWPNSFMHIYQWVIRYRALGSLWSHQLIRCHVHVTFVFFSTSLTLGYNTQCLFATIKRDQNL